MTVGRIPPPTTGTHRPSRATPAANDGGASAPTGPASAGPSPFREALQDAARSIGRGERVVQRAIHAGRRGTLAPEQLIALQAGVYRYTQELELASKVADKAASAVRQTLQSQQ